MAKNLLFLKFKIQEFDKLSKLLCQIFVTSEAEIEKLYQDMANDFNKDDWPPHFARRDFFQSKNREFQKICDQSPVIAVDLPSVWELDDGIQNKPTVVILGQDSKSDQDCENIRIGTPYGLHHKGSREILTRTKHYFNMIDTLLRLGYRVYLTDVYKAWVCDPNRPYERVILPRSDRERFINFLKSELYMMNPVLLVTWGEDAANSISQLDLNILHLKLPHPSGAANGAWRKLLNQSPTNANKLEYWKSAISQSLAREA